MIVYAEPDNATRGSLWGASYWFATRIAKVWTFRKIYTQGGIEAPLFQREQSTLVMQSKQAVF